MRETRKVDKKEEMCQKSGKKENISKVNVKK